MTDTDSNTNANTNMTAFEKAAKHIKIGEKPVIINVCWYREKIGTILLTGQGIKWGGYASAEMEKFFGDTIPSRETDGMPQFLVNLVPQNDVFEQLGIETQADYLSSGLRFLSNIIISGNAPFDLPFPNDYLQADFDNFIDKDGIFTGTYLGKPPRSLEVNALAKELSTIWKNRYVPRFSGKEMKIPVTLQEEGELQKAIKTPFTHFLKLPNEGLQEGWGVNEWMCMQLCAATGLPTAKHALVDIDDSLPPAYLVERFDINHEHRAGIVRRLIHDFCSLAGMRTHKGSAQDFDERKEGLAAGSIEQVAKTLKQYSTNPQEDLENLFKRSLVSYAVGDMDMHRKNISMLFRYDVSSGKMIEARFAPAYDITSEIHEQEDRLHLLLPMGNKNINMKHKTFMTCAKAIGIPEDRAAEIIEHTMTSLARRAVEIANNPPDLAVKTDLCKYTLGRITTIVTERTKQLGFAVPEWTPVKRVTIPQERLGHDTRPLDMSIFAPAPV